MSPLQIKVKEKKYLFIKWDDGSESQIKNVNLRRYCPCAECEAERQEQGEKYIPLYSDVQLTIKDIRMVGNYAVGIVWADEHSTGIYEFNYLKKISGS